jgi:hypothetical protein
VQYTAANQNQNPPIGNVKLEELIDNPAAKTLEDSGFVQKTYATYGVVRSIDRENKE